MIIIFNEIIKLDKKIKVEIYKTLSHLCEVYFLKRPLVTV